MYTINGKGLSYFLIYVQLQYVMTHYGKKRSSPEDERFFLSTFNK